MVAINVTGQLVKRYCSNYNGYNGYYNNCNTAWGSWGRWLTVGLCILVFFVLLSCCMRVTGTRRRRQGLTPYAGTAWMVPKYDTGANAQYPNGPSAYNPPETQVGSPYGNQQTYPQQYYPDTNAQPQQAYNQYAPPAGGPPPDSYAMGNIGGSHTQYAPPANPPPTHNKY